MKIIMSICPFNDGMFEVLIKEKETGKELAFEGRRANGFSADEIDLINKIAPPCVWTEFERTTPGD